MSELVFLKNDDFSKIRIVSKLRNMSIQIDSKNSDDNFSEILLQKIKQKETVNTKIKLSMVKKDVK